MYEDTKTRDANGQENDLKQGRGRFFFSCKFFASLLANCIDCVVFPFAFPIGFFFLFSNMSVRSWLKNFSFRYQNFFFVFSNVFVSLFQPIPVEISFFLLNLSLLFRII